MRLAPRMHQRLQAQGLKPQVLLNWTNMTTGKATWCARLANIRGHNVDHAAPQNAAITYATGPPAAPGTTS